eukprot:913965-Amorphochlora_amoeboformis.AAC.2
MITKRDKGRMSPFFRGRTLHAPTASLQLLRRARGLGTLALDKGLGVRKVPREISSYIDGKFAESGESLPVVMRSCVYRLLGREREREREKRSYPREEKWKRGYLYLCVRVWYDGLYD